MSRNLVLARVGASSLHGSWLSAGVPRDWDLHLVPFQPVPFASGPGVVVADVIPGPKWAGVREYLRSWDGWREYDYVWIPDDDIFVTQGTISAMFEVARTVGLDLFAPALHEASYFAHFSTMRNTSFFGRWTGFVEIMVPAFSRQALDQLVHTLDLSETGWGWGLDSLWPKLLEYRNVGVIDALPVLHTRPVGRMRDLDLAKRVLDESDHIMDRFDCRQVHTSFGAFNDEGAAVKSEPERFFADLARGWQHLVDRDPRVLTWLVEFQQELFEWPEYPVAGTPS
ncbi:DUF707 domain-containing protein [Nocardioides sp. URHA0020]|uniref:DUF707 domain-containing protein n=1 Tax=Nocardioides sp. URHA0020 TaxID=1380392 RepID=UPI0012DBDE7E|nr:DUF707 domain-containing protein [Nocardioides sp. URHA0020]